MPGGPDELAELERRRKELYRELGQVGDFRRGSLNEVRRKCGKPNCACAAPGHLGHGPQYNRTRSEGGKNVCATHPLSYRRNGMSIFVLLAYSGYALGKVAARFRSSTIPQ